MNIELSPAQKNMYCKYISLLAAVLNGRQPDELPDNFPWKFFCKHAQRNSILNILAYGIDKLKNKPDDVIVKVAENDKNYSIIKETSQLLLVEEVLAEFEKNRIKNLPLKGYFMKHLYPQSDFRTMTDVDILVEKSDFKKIKKVFQDLKCESIDLIKSDEIHFQKDLTYFEIQSDLNARNEEYFYDIWSKTKNRDEYEYSYCLTDEDFYIYLVYHCAKHFFTGGVGIRMIMDIYVYLKNYRNLDWEYIEKAFKELKIFEFEQKVRKIAINWFSDDDTQITPMGEFILSCSTFGELSVFFCQDNLNTKGSYWIKQVFIPYSTMKKRYHYLKKLPFLLPVSWIQYWVTRIFIKRDIRVKQGLKGRAGVTISDKDKEFIKNIMYELNK